MGSSPEYVALQTNKAKEAFRSQWAMNLEKARETKKKTEVVSKSEGATSKEKYLTKSQLEDYYKNSLTAKTHIQYCLDRQLTEYNAFADETTYMLLDIKKEVNTKRQLEEEHAWEEPTNER